jgi:hypothetical protein
MASPINMNLAKHQGLDDGKAPRCEFDACGVQHRGLHRNHRAEGNVEVDGQDQEFLDLVSGALLQCRLRGGLDCHDGLSYLGFPQGIVVRTIPYRPPQANNKELSQPLKLRKLRCAQLNRISAESYTSCFISSAPRAP